MAIPQPIPYQGSKRNLAEQILTYIPKGTENLIEPFAGSGALSIAAAYHNQVKNIILNDLNKPLMQIWKQILQNPYNLSNKYRDLWNGQLGREKDFYLKVRDEFNNNPTPEKLLYLLARCVKNAIRYNERGDFNQGADNRRKGRAPDKMEKEILNTYYLLSHKTKLFSKDYTDITSHAKDNDVIYMDPPYQGAVKSSKRYIQKLEFEKFIEHLEHLNSLNKSFIISFDGRTGDKIHGNTLPDYLQLKRVELHAGRSSQATLLGRNQETYESVYLSKKLTERLEDIPKEEVQLELS